MGFFGKMFGKKVNEGKNELAKIENRDLMQAIVGGALLVAYADGECEDAELSCCVLGRLRESSTGLAT